MPKIITDAEREQVREAIYHHSIQLIREKGVKKVTVDDIAAAVGIGKGSLYAYYPSREAALYEVILRGQRELFARMEAILAGGLPQREQLVQVMREVFLASDSIFFHVSATDIEVLLRKLPTDYQQLHQNKSDDFFQRGLSMLKVSEGKMEVVGLLTDCLAMVAAHGYFSEGGKQAALDVLVGAMADYIVEEEAK